MAKWVEWSESALRDRHEIYVFLVEEDEGGEIQ